MNVVRKDASITQTSDEGNGEFHVILSAQTVDRDGDTLTTDGWEQPLPDHITFDMDHGMSVASLVGSGSPFINKDTGNLEVKGTFAGTPEGQKVRQLVNEGHCRTTSVAFMTKKVSKAAGGDGVRTVRELLNGAFVAIPSNREATVLSSKGLKAGARNSASDAEALQNIHDAAAGLGADCAAAKSHRPPTVKTIVGSIEATQERVRDALGDFYGQRSWPWLRGTVPDGNGGGYAVYDVDDQDSWERATYQQTYTDDGQVVTLTGDARPVDVMEIIVSDPDAEEASGTALDPAAGAPAPAAGLKAVPVADERSNDMSTRAARLRMLSNLTAHS